MALTTTLQYSESNLVGTLQTSLGTTTSAFDVVFRDRVTGEAREPLSTTKLFVIDKGSAASPNPQYEIIYGSHTTSGGVTSFTGVVRGLEFSGVSLAAVTARQKTHIAGAEVGVVDLHYLTSTIVATLKGVGDVTAQLTVADHTARDADITATEGQIIYVDSVNCYEMYKNGAWWLLEPTFADDTARDAAIPSPVNGMSCYNTAEGVHQDYVGGAWANRGTSTTANGSTTVAGKFEEATDAEVGASTTTGGTGARLAINPGSVVKTSSGAGDENKLAALDSTGKFASGFIPTSQEVPKLAQGRLTFTSGTPIHTASSTYTTVYYTPYHGNILALYDGSSTWGYYEFTEITLSLSGLTADKNHDVFVYDNSGALTLVTVEWTNDTTRATALTTQDGVYVQSGSTTHRYLGTLRTTSTTGQSAWLTGTTKQLFLWNAYNRHPYSILFEDNTLYTSFSSVSAQVYGANSDNKIETIQGLAEGLVDITADMHADFDSVSVTADMHYYFGVGVNSSSSFTTSKWRYHINEDWFHDLYTHYTGTPSARYNTYYIMESATKAGGGSFSIRRDELRAVCTFTM